MMFRSLITLKEVCFVLLLVSILHCEGNVLERLEYEEGESSVTITRCRLGIDPVVVPDTINGKPVTAIGDGVISACDHVRNEIILPKGITSIGKLDYQGNHGAIRVVFTGDAPEMEARDSDQGFAGVLFAYQPGASGFTTPFWKGYPCAPKGEKFEHLEYVEDKDSVTITWSSNPYSESLIPETIHGKPVTAIGPAAFANNICFNRIMVQLPSTLQTIGPYAFYNFAQGWNSVDGNLTITSSVTEIGDYAFAQCPKIGRVTFEGNAPFLGVGVFDDAYPGLRLVFNTTASGFTTPLWQGYPSDPKGSPAGDFEIVDEGETITITDYFGGEGDIIIPDTIHGKPVTAIRAGSFIGRIPNKQNISIQLPSSLKKIGDYAFARSWSVGKVIFSGDAPATGSRVFDDAFQGLRLVFPSGAQGFTTPLWRGYTCQTIGERLGDFQIVDEGKTITITDYFGGEGEIVIPDTIHGKPVTAIGTAVFARGKMPWCTKLTLPKTLIEIGNLAFFGAERLRDTIRLPEGLKTVGDFAFADCDVIGKTLTVPASVERIGHGAFHHCELSHVVFEGNAPITGDEPFETGGSNVDYEGISLNKTFLTFPPEATGFSTPFWKDCPCGPQGERFGNYEYIENDKTVSIVRYHGEEDTVRIPDEINGKPVTSIGPFAFVSNNLRLFSLGLPSGLESIGEGAFYNCPIRDDITIPKGVSKIGDNAFSRCTDVRRYDFQGDAPEMGEKVFGDIFSPRIIPIVVFNPNATGFTTPKWNNLACSPKGRIHGDFEYTESEDSITIKWYSGSQDNLVIPDFINGKPVTTIGEGAFDGAQSHPITLLLPPTLTTIKCGALGKFTGLSGELIIPRSVQSIEAGALPESDQFRIVFEGDAPSIEEYSIPDALIAYKTGSTGFDTPAWTNASCMPLGKTLGDFEYSETGDSITITWYSGKGRRVVIPDFIDGKPVTMIGERAFAGASESLSTVILPSTLVTIKRRAFANCDGLSGTLVIPRSVRSIEDLAFGISNNLGRIVFEGDAPQLGEWALSNTGITYNSGSEGFTTPEWNGYPCFPRDKVSGGFEFLESEDSITITWYSGKDGRVVIPDFIDGKPVTTIGERAFAGSFESPSIVVLPPTLTTIKQKAFADSTGLSGTLIIPRSVRSIEDHAFRNTPYLFRIVFEGDAPTLGKGAIQHSRIAYNPGSEGFTAPEWNDYPCFPRDNISGDFEYSETGDSITITGYCGSGGDIIIPDFIDGKPVTTIGERAFVGTVFDTRIIQLKLPIELETIEDSAFLGCYGNVESVTFPPKLRKIGEVAFAHCMFRFGFLTIPPSVTEIGTGAFRDCTGPKRVYFRGDAPKMGRAVFDRSWQGFSIQYEPTAKGFTTPTWLDYPCNPIRRIRSDFDFTNNGSTITISGYSGSGDRVIIPHFINGLPVTAIGDRAFQRKILDPASLSLPPFLESIGTEAFAMCSGLTGSVEIPPTVGTIGEGAFSGCSRLDEVRFLGDAPKTGPSIFDGNKSGFMIIYDRQAKGFDAPTWHAYPASVDTD